MGKKFLMIAGISGVLAVILGASLKAWLMEHLSDDDAETYATAVSFHAFHTTALLAIAMMSDRFRTRISVTGGYCLAAGVVFFCGPLYLHSLRSIIGIESWWWLTWIASAGSLAFIAGWILIFVTGLMVTGKIKAEDGSRK